MAKRARGGESTGDEATLKERILRAAIAEFAVSGYHLTALRAIGEQAGSNKPMIYYHFGGKDGLYLAAVRQLLEETATRLHEASDQGAPALVRLRRFAEVYLDAFLLTSPMMGTVLREMNSLAGPVYDAIGDEHNRLIVVQLRRILADGVEAGDFHRLDIDGCIGGLLSLLLGPVRFRHTAPQSAMRSALAQIMDYYAAGLVATREPVHHAP